MTEPQRLFIMLLSTIARLKLHRFTNERDAVYGCFGLVSSTLGPGCVDPLERLVDYSLSVANVFTNITWAMLQNMRYLDALNMVEDDGFRRTRSRSWPSWVPRFSTISNMISPPTLNPWDPERGQQSYNASRRQAPTSSFSLETVGLLLTLRGAMVSPVSEAGPELQRTEGRLAVEWFVRMLLSREGTYPGTGEHVGQALARALTADRCLKIEDEGARAAAFREWWLRRIPPRMARLEKARAGSGAHLPGLLARLPQNAGQPAWFPSSMASASPPSGDGDDDSRDEELEYNVAEISRYIETLWYPRRFFTSKDGRFGVGPKSLRPTDEVWILEGGRTPFVLRKRDDGGTYRLVGEAFVHGMMYGELATPDLLDRMGPVILK
jgi:hypothetical protein